MGRYAFFNSGFEYKFVFAVQPSSDIELFGGYVIRGYYESDNCMEYQWTQNDKEFILNKIKDYNIDFENYEKNVDGTYKLKYDLYDKEYNCTILLGCLIYHQLLYIKVLTCKYELL